MQSVQCFLVLNVYQNSIEACTADGFYKNWKLKLKKNLNLAPHLLFVIYIDTEYILFIIQCLEILKNLEITTNFLFLNLFSLT